MFILRAAPVHCRCQVLEHGAEMSMPELVLDRQKARAPVEEIGRQAVAKQMRKDAPANPGAVRKHADHFSHITRGETVAPLKC